MKDLKVKGGAQHASDRTMEYMLPPCKAHAPNECRSFVGLLLAGSLAMAMKDPYQTLGVARNATQDEIKNAYRALAKKYHPDLNPGNKEVDEKFKEVSQAYELIGSPENRSKYDRGEFDEAQAGAGFGSGRRRQGPFYYQTQGGGPGGPGGRYSHSFGGAPFDEDLFSHIFGSMGGGAGQGAGAGPFDGGFTNDELYRMDIDLRDSVTGAEKEITLPGGKRLSVKIPPGVSEGTRLRFAGQAASAPGGAPAGDVYVELHIRQDERFRIEGDNLVTDLPVDLTDALFGAEVRVQTLDKDVLVKVPARSSSGTRLKLRGKGLYNRATKRRGDLILNIQVMLPGVIDPELEQALQALHERKQQRGAA